MKSIILILLSFLLVSNRSFAKDRPAIRGKVVNQDSQPINGASIYLMTPTARAILKTAVTDEAGEYLIADFPAGTFIIEATALGYVKAETATFRVQESGLNIPVIVLSPQTKAIEEVTVRGELPMIQHSNGKLIMNVENSSISAGNNAFEVLKRAPGVNVDKDENISLMGQQGVNVTIDGRPTYMTGEQLASFLKGSDGSQIKSIELSTTRSAKDDAEGAAGVINITMKKSKLEGFNGSWIASAAMGKQFRGNSSINLNYKKNNSTFFSNYSYTDNKTDESLDIERIIPGKNGKTYFDQFTDLKHRNKTHNYKVGLEQKTSGQNTFMIQFTGNNNVKDQNNYSLTNMGSQVSVIDSIMESFTRGKERFNKYSFNANNEFKIDTNGKKLIADMDYSLFKTQNKLNYDYHTYFPDMSYIYAPEYELSDALTDIKILAAKLDYLQKLWKGNIEAGLKYSNVSSDNDIDFDQLIAEVWQGNAERTNTFYYIEQIASAYMDYSRQINRWGLKVGLRGEYTLSDGNSITENKRVKRDYFDLFPSLSVSYTKDENHVLAFSYARKISRPNYRHLNPFEYYIDKRTFMRGNPYLNPQYTDGFSLNYTLFKMFNIALGHDLTHDAMVESMGQDKIEKTTWVTRENLGKQHTTYLNLSIPARIGRFWTMYNNLTGIHMHFRGPVAGYYVSQGSIFFQGKSTNNFKVNKAISAELGLSYNSPFLYNVYQIEGRFNTDVGATYNFKDQRSSIKIGVTDVFHTNYNNLFTRFEEYDSKIHQYNDSQTVRITFNYKFGNLKQSVRRRENVSEEKDRAQ